MVLAGNSTNIKVAESVQLQLESHGWLKMTIDGVFLELGEGKRGGEKAVSAMQYCMPRSSLGILP